MNFKATILGACASVIALSAATAADLPSRKAPVAPPPPVFSWTGWHGGVVGGYAGGDASYNINRYALNGAAWVRNATAGTSGFIVGYESGYTWQLPNNITIGYEGDYSYTNISPDGGRSYYGGVNSNLTYFGTERLRFGYAMGRLMPYITGGLAYGYFNGVSYGQSNGLWIASGSSANRWGGGWTVGAGLEYALMDHVSVKAEYLYSSIMAPSGGSAVSLNNSGVAVVNGGNYNLNLARVGVNYRVKSIGALLGFDGLGDF